MLFLAGLPNAEQNRIRCVDIFLHEPGYGIESLKARLHVDEKTVDIGVIEPVHITAMHIGHPQHAEAGSADVYTKFRNVHRAVWPVVTGQPVGFDRFI